MGHPSWCSLHWSNGKAPKWSQYDSDVNYVCVYRLVCIPYVAFDLSFVCLSVCPLSVYLSLCLSPCLTICLSVFPSVCPSVCRFFYLSVYAVFLLRSIILASHSLNWTASNRSRLVTPFIFSCLSFCLYAYVYLSVRQSALLRVVSQSHRMSFDFTFVMNSASVEEKPTGNGARRAKQRELKQSKGNQRKQREPNQSKRKEKQSNGNQSK